MALLGFAGSASANLVQNGGFELLTGAPNNTLQVSQPVGWDPYTGAQAVTFAPGTADTTGANFEGATFFLWGPNDGSTNGLPAASPAGGNYVSFDADPVNARDLSQTINGLVPGHEYQLSFYWAAAQYRNAGGTAYNGATTTDFTVSLGGETDTTPSASIPSHGFSGWMLETFDYTATSPSEVLSFLAAGTSNLPPVALLDGVSVASVPEPDSWALLMAFGFGGLGLAAYRKRKRPVAL